jgi:type IV secretion system protein VirD4
VAGRLGARMVLGGAPEGWVTTRAEQALLVIGPPRSGKTRGVVVPNVLAAEGAVLSTSTKPDVMQATLAERSRTGPCWLYDPTGSVSPPAGVTPLRWSPLCAASSWDEAVRMSATIVGAARDRTGEAAHWIERAEALLAPLMHASALAGSDMATLVSDVNRRDAQRARAVLEAAGAKLAVDLLAGVTASEERELSGIWSTASGTLSAYRTAAALETTRDPNWDAESFLASGGTVYVCAPGDRQRAVAPLVAGLVDQVRAAGYARHAAGTAYPPVLLALDEAANIAPLPELPALVSEGGGQGVLTLACFQDLSQARARWGKAADGFMSLFGSKLVLGGVGDVATLEAISRICGLEEVRVRSTNRQGLRHSGGWSSRRQARLSPEEVRRGRPGRALVIDADAPAGWVPMAQPRPRERSRVLSLDRGRS